MMFSSRHFFQTIALGVFSIPLPAQATLQGTVSFLNFGSRPAVGLDISVFGANTVSTTEAGMFMLKFLESGRKLFLSVSDICNGGEERVEPAADQAKICPARYPFVHDSPDSLRKRECFVV